MNTKRKIKNTKKRSYNKSIKRNNNRSNKSKKETKREKLIHARNLFASVGNHLL
jgi:hypothetical protein